MAYDAKFFLGQWVRDHAKPVPFSTRQEEAERLAALCRDVASLAGVAEEQLENEAGMDLISYMDERIQAATFDEWQSCVAG